MAILQGKKTPLALITFIIATSVGYGELKNTVADNKTKLEGLDKERTQVVEIKQDVSNLKERINRLDKRQSEGFDKAYNKLDDLLFHIRKQQ